MVVLGIIPCIGRHRVQSMMAAAWRRAGVKSGESWLGPMSVTTPMIRCGWVCSTAVSLDQARCRWPEPFPPPRRLPKCSLMCRVSSPVASTAATGAASISLAERARSMMTTWT
jgi:hypothetical protein